VKVKKVRKGGKKGKAFPKAGMEGEEGVREAYKKKKPSPDGNGLYSLSLDDFDLRS
jgi:hypothetical protein